MPGLRPEGPPFIAPRAGALALALSTLALGCAGVQGGGHAAAGAIKEGTLTPGRPASANYGPDPALGCSAEANSIASLDLESSARTSHTQAAKPDGRLCAAAEAFLGWTGKDVPDENVVRFVAWYFGLTSPNPRVTITAVQSESQRSIATMLLDPLTKVAQSISQPRYGVATQRLGRDSSKLVLLVQDQSVDIEPVPKRLALNSSAPLKGQLVGSYANPQVLLSNAIGELETPKMPPGKTFQAELKCGDRPGRMQVEIRAEQQGAEGVVADFPVYCGTEPPTSVAIEKPPTGPVDVASEEKKLFELINAERTSAGLPPLTWDDAVAGVARADAEGRRDGKQVDLVQALKQVEVASPLIVQNPAQARSADEAHARFSTSPRHRANYMSSAVTQGAVGMAAGSDPSGRPTLFISELFVKQLPPINTEEVRQKLRSAIARKRKDARAAALKSDPLLEDVAQKYVQALADAKGNLPKARQDEILAPVRKPFLTVNVISGAKNEPLDFAEEPGIIANLKVYGIGVAQGAHTQLGKNATYVTVLMGTRR